MLAYMLDFQRHWRVQDLETNGVHIWGRAMYPTNKNAKAGLLLNKIGLY